MSGGYYGGKTLSQYGITIFKHSKKHIDNMTSSNIFVEEIIDEDKLIFYIIENVRTI